MKFVEPFGEISKVGYSGSILIGKKLEDGQGQATLVLCKGKARPSNILAAARLDLNEAAMPMKLREDSGMQSSRGRGDIQPKVHF